ncbi:MAG: hypothetical protein CVV27_00230 [Candidatus Melainabacteria bacterium HGW-Melainabacteria-1]|nr:MAG: hypothetical protein CVV27_00230 [Candidatus Melainabacteria bacterium HGW-Melainabacteria-1]
MSDAQLVEQVPIAETKPLSYPYFGHLRELVEQLQQAPNLVLELISEGYLNFACTLCGDCCRMPWAITLSQAYYEAWYEPLAQHPSGQYPEPFLKLEKPTETAYATISRQRGTHACVFLQADNSCWIHAEYGVEALSDVCRKYPRHIKDVGHQYAVRNLLHSCQAVPETEARFPGLYYRIYDPSATTPMIHGIAARGYPGRFETYLWLGMALDLLEAPRAGSLLSRWRLFPAALEWMDGIGMEKLQIHHLLTLYQDLMDKVDSQGLSLPDLSRQRLALEWAQIFMADHPGCTGWIQDVLKAERPWPELSEAEARLLDTQMRLYARNRLLVIPYRDNFLGNLSFWQQFMLLGIQLLCLQCLALYNASRDGELRLEHLQRAVNAIGFRLEQRGKLIKELGLDRLRPEQAYDSLITLHSLDFAALPLSASLP